jgi:ribonucleoside-diphosphate reductase alpha chain
VASRLLLDTIYKEVLGVGSQPCRSSAPATGRDFKRYIDIGIEVERLDPKLKDYDLHQVGGRTGHRDRDMDFTYLGMQTVYDRYLQHHQDHRIETPQYLLDAGGHGTGHQ